MPPIKSNSGNLVTNDTDKAELLNTQFVDNFSLERTDQVPYLKREYPTMPDIHVTAEGVHKLLNGLKTTRAAVPDDIHPRVLKEIALPISPLLACIFQKSLDTGVLPSDWRIANIWPIHKKGDRSNANNYRPVSLTSITCKLLEHVISTNIMHHLDTYEILSNRQNAFRKKRSCTTQLCSVLDDWTKALDMGSQIDIFILDFAKAFDKGTNAWSLNYIAVV